VADSGVGIVASSSDVCVRKKPSLREGLGGPYKVGYPKSEENKGTIVTQRVVAQPDVRKGADGGADLPFRFRIATAKSTGH
jgi:hypothetical protein